jgi:hypothetical protein
MHTCGAPALRFIRGCLPFVNPHEDEAAIGPVEQLAGQRQRHGRFWPPVAWNQD